MRHHWRVRAFCVASLTATVVLVTPAATRPITPATAPDPARHSAALDLAKIVNSEALLIGNGAIDVRSVVRTLELLEDNAELAAINTKYPLVWTHEQALSPIIARSFRQRLPQLWDRQAALYAAHFSAPELATLKRFATSSTGQKLLSQLAQSAQPIRIAVTDAGAAPRDFLGNELRAPAAINRHDKAMLRMLTQSGLMPRLRAVAPETQGITYRWASETAPWEQAETTKALAATLDAIKTKATSQ
jgi:hypothetical protein